MCAGSLINALVQTLGFRATDPNAVLAGSLYNVCTDPRMNHNPAIVNAILKVWSRAELQRFFVTKRT